MKTQNPQFKTAGPRIASTIVGLLIRLKTYRAAVLALFFAAATLLGTSAASADTITVFNTNDSGPGTLRQALVDANNGDTINFDSSLNGQKITLTSGQLSVDKDVTISGPGAKNLAVGGNAQSRVFYANPGKTATIDGLTVANGYSDYGGGIYNEDAALTVTNCVFSGNSAFSGGGIANYAFNGSATLTITNCTLSDNLTADGGGISNAAFNVGSATLTVTNCTLSGNSAGKDGGGGIYNQDAALTVTNSTISSNSASQGGGIANYALKATIATVTITNSTISGNSATGNGGGIFNYAFNASIAAVETGNTIFGAHGSGENIVNYAGTVTSLGYNISSDDGGGFLTAAGDQTNTDPLLGPLQDNGGPTFTHALLTGSPAIDAGDPNFTPPPDYDQRGPGFDRVVNGRIDVGSFEVQGPTPTPTPTPTATPRPSPTPRVAPTPRSRPTPAPRP